MSNEIKFVQDMETRNPTSFPLRRRVEGFWLVYKKLIKNEDTQAASDIMVEIIKTVQEMLLTVPEQFDAIDSIIMTPEEKQFIRSQIKK